MSVRAIAGLALPLGLLVRGIALADEPLSPPGAGYADDLSALSSQARDFDRRPEAVFSYCARNTAVYECLSYGQDGAVRKERKKVVLHGTAFAYKRQGQDTYLLTNDHVAVWPSVTDPQHVVSGVPSGCKRVSETLALVDDEHDTYDRDDVSLTRVVSDPGLDVAVLKTRADLHVLPWKIGHSAYLRERNVVEVRGFPLGAFRATNVGKVVSARDHDDYGDWNHDDFVVDALLSSGNSGSPVLAVSSATGEYELVGVFHAGYTEGSALNVVVGIDQIRDLMTTLKKTLRDHKEEAVSLDQTNRASLLEALGIGKEMFFPFGTLVGVVRGLPGDALLFAVFQKDFPFSSEPSFVAEDLPSTGSGDFGELARVWIGSHRGIDEHDPKALDAETQAEISKLLDALRSDACAHSAYRASWRQEADSRDSSERAARMAKTLNRTAATRVELIQTIADLSERLIPTPGQRATTLAEITPIRQPLSPERSTPSAQAGTDRRPIGGLPPNSQARM